MEERFDISSKLIKGRNGVFEVTLDGDLVFSKKATGRFPDDDEVVTAIAQRVA